MKKRFMEIKKNLNSIIKNSFLRWVLKEFAYIIIFVWINIILMCYLIIIRKQPEFIPLVGILSGAVGLPQIAGYIVKYFQAKIEKESFQVGQIKYETYNSDEGITEIEGEGK